MTEPPTKLKTGIHLCLVQSKSAPSMVANPLVLKCCSQHFLILTDWSLDSGLDFYWTGAVKNLDAEADTCEHAISQQDALQVADMQIASSMTDTSSSSSSVLFSLYFRLLDTIYCSCRIFYYIYI
jgi:hypothetical protein